MEKAGAAVGGRQVESGECRAEGGREPDLPAASAAVVDVSENLVLQIAQAVEDFT